MGINKTTVTKVFKLRGKGGDKTPPKTATFEVAEATDLAGALELVGGDEAKVLGYFNAGYADAVHQAKYNELFGDEVKMNATIRTLVEAGIPEELARTQVKAMFDARPAVATT
jgi:hypothetical protein